MFGCTVISYSRVAKNERCIMNAKLNVSGFSAVTEEELLSVNGGLVKEIIEIIKELFGGDKDKGCCCGCCK